MLKFEKLTVGTGIALDSDEFATGLATVAVGSSTSLKGEYHLVRDAGAIMAAVGVSSENNLAANNSVALANVKMTLHKQISRVYKLKSSDTSLNLGFDVADTDVSSVIFEDPDDLAAGETAGTATKSAVSAAGVVTISNATAGRVKVTFDAVVCSGAAEDKEASANHKLNAVEELHINALCRLVDAADERHPHLTSCTIRPEGAIHL